MAVKPPAGAADALSVPAVRRAATAPASGVVRASDIKGRIIGETPVTFAAGKQRGRGEVHPAGRVAQRDRAHRDRRGRTPPAPCSCSTTAGAGAASGFSPVLRSESAQPLLSPLYYISRAVEPFADVRQPRDANAAIAVPDLIQAGCSVIAMADIGNLTPDVENQVSELGADGGVLVRFAGPRLAAADRLR